jgi:Dyp-type peroxidase family
MQADNFLELHDIQGQIVKGYGRFGFPYARYVLFCVKDGAAGRHFVHGLIPMITSSIPWKSAEFPEGNERPIAAVNIAFTYHGLKKLELPEVSLHSFPEDFSGGMYQRRDILGDDGKSSPEYWDSVWNDGDNRVCILVMINAATEEAREEKYQEIVAKADSKNSGVILLYGHKGDDGQDNLPYQDAAALTDDKGEFCAKEHFGYTDGIVNPFFNGTGANPAFALGTGKLTGENPASIEGWQPLEAGEFILGYKDEAQELPLAPYPSLLGKNGSFIVYRKLHENVGSFYHYIKNEATNHPSQDQEVIAAKFAGRWRNGAPIATFTTEEDAEKFMQEVGIAKAAIKKAPNKIEKEKAEYNYLMFLSKLVGFDYNDDLEGSRCPVGAHIRRANPRGSLEYGVKDAYNTPGALDNRRRILRRGLPYGHSKDKTNDTGNHGIIFMAVCASIQRQFEFVQQQWINYGNDFKLANEKDAILGNHQIDKNGQSDGKMLFQTPKNSGQSPHFCKNIPRFVETRGGEYFFIPSITALNMIADGTVDST